MGKSDDDLLSRAAREIVRRRWEATSQEERSAVARDLNEARWERWRAENPEKAAASEERRRKRAAVAAPKKKGKKAKKR